MADHMCNGLFEDEEGWWAIECTCGSQLGAAPSAEDAADILMGHAYAAGWLDSKAESLIESVEFKE